MSRAHKIAAPQPVAHPRPAIHAIESTQWRVRNAEIVADHWNIGELDMFDADSNKITGENRNIKKVICSFNYDDHLLDVVHDGNDCTVGNADFNVWAGSDRQDAQSVGGSWLGYEFKQPQKVQTVRMAQSVEDSQRVSKVWLEACIDGKWTKVQDLTFAGSVAIGESEHRGRRFSVGIGVAQEAALDVSLAEGEHTKPERFGAGFREATPMVAMPQAGSTPVEVLPEPASVSELTPDERRAKVFAEAFVEEHMTQLREVFDKCDTNGDGHVSKFELARKLRDSMDVAKVLEDGRVKESLEAMLEDLNKESGRKLTWPQFRDLFCVSLQHHEVARLA